MIIRTERQKMGDALVTSTPFAFGLLFMVQTNHLPLDCT